MAPPRALSQRLLAEKLKAALLGKLRVLRRERLLRVAFGAFVDLTWDHRKALARDFRSLRWKLAAFVGEGVRRRGVWRAAAACLCAWRAAVPPSEPPPPAPLHLGVPPNFFRPPPGLG
jgi:hypothetical protein